ncbi:hypothetical protein Dsin_031083 [Dipteronia sinensis]|uniref:Uncharacterized protein n=1 Tax=Dipteronia sinensis TaxID=43782 RepID=A0AAE0DS10_9ROSI|nr:hypothetical protein Dsin_031083 [Dipteronia sinensis]
MSNSGRKRLRVEQSRRNQALLALSSRRPPPPLPPRISPTNSPVYSPPSISHTNSPVYSPTNSHHGWSPDYSIASADFSPSSLDYSPLYHPDSPSYNPVSPLYRATSVLNDVALSPISAVTSPLSPHYSPPSDSPVQDSGQGEHEEGFDSPRSSTQATSTENALEIAEQLFRAVPPSEIEQLRQLDMEDLIQTSITSTFRAALGFSLARDGNNFLDAERRRLQAEKEGLAARVVELEKELSIERDLMTTRFIELAGKNARLQELQDMLEEEEQINANLRRKVRRLPAQVEDALDSFQTSREFEIIKGEVYSKGFDDCRVRVSNHFPGVELSFLDQNEPDTAAMRD